MVAKIVIAPEVEQDIDEAYLWYESQRLGLGDEFLDCVDACIESMRRMPEKHAVTYSTYRRALIQRFPHAVFMNTKIKHCMFTRFFINQLILKSGKSAYPKTHT